MGLRENLAENSGKANGILFLIVGLEEIPMMDFKINYLYGRIVQILNGRYNCSARAIFTSVGMAQAHIKVADVHGGCRHDDTFFVSCNSQVPLRISEGTK